MIHMIHIFTQKETPPYIVYTVYLIVSTQIM
jgi:hypothetical protein